MAKKQKRARFPFWKKYKPFIFLGFLLLALITTLVLANQNQELRSRADTSTGGVPSGPSSGCCSTDGQCKDWFGTASSCTNGNGACASGVQCRGGAPKDPTTGQTCAGYSEHSCDGKACGEKICGGAIECRNNCTGNPPGVAPNGCNNNRICESNNKETSSSCPNDCRPATASEIQTRRQEALKADLLAAWKASGKADFWTAAWKASGGNIIKFMELITIATGLKPSCRDGGVCNEGDICTTAENKFGTGENTCGNCPGGKYYNSGLLQKCGAASTTTSGKIQCTDRLSDESCGGSHNVGDGCITVVRSGKCTLGSRQPTDGADDHRCSCQPL